jgi:hypothetical protein
MRPRLQYPILTIGALRPRKGWTMAQKGGRPFFVPDKCRIPNPTLQFSMIITIMSTYLKTMNVLTNDHKMMVCISIVGLHSMG